ncbi:GIN domain-containing protein [Jejudonia soesokkakensis]|uniref:GIN domain-containing protein n=1 Tax=Jejudonia soesokkakensis TaxID=1323432 RepID=A0ABW2MMF7_9FLAO
MKKFITLALCGIITLSCVAQKKPKIKGDKNVVDITESIDQAFNAIEIDDALEVDLLPASKPFYRLETDFNLSRILQFKVEDSVLKIYSDYKITSSKKLKIELSASGIDAITLKNDAKIESKRKLESKVMVLTANESSRFDLDIEADSIAVNITKNAGGKLNLMSEKTDIKMNGRTDLKVRNSSDNLVISIADNGDLDIDGNSDTGKYNLTDGSQLKGKKLRVNKASINLSNNAYVEVFVAKDLEVYAKDKSKIELWGEPKINIKGLLGDAEIEKKD